MTMFKVLDGLRPVHGGDGRYPGVGRWTEHLDPALLRPRVYGYHLARGPQILDWWGPTLYEAEPCPEHGLVAADGKLVTCRVRLVRRLDRWTETTARLFAADCAEAALLGERASGREPDGRSWAAVEAARAFARGELSLAALSAAREAVLDASWDSVRAGDEDPARAAALAAAWAAADDPAWAAALAAAGDAASAAASAAAVEAASAFAMAAAYDSAWDAARDAARAAARDAQYRRLRLYLEGAELPPVEALYGEEARAE